MSSPTLPGFFGTIAPPLDRYGYLAVAVLVLAEDFGVPSPGETVLIAAAVYAGAGRLNVLAVAVIGFLAAVAGDNIGFAIGHFGGRRVLAKFGRFVLLTPARVAKAESFFARNGGKVVIVARFVEGLRQANGILAGIGAMSWLRFLGFNVLGAALWVGLWVSVGDLAGSHIDTVYAAVHTYTGYAAVLAVLAIVAFVALRVRRRRTGR